MYVCAVWTGGESTDLGEDASLPILPRKGTCASRRTQVGCHEVQVVVAHGELGQTEESVEDDDEKRKAWAFGRD